MSNTGGRETVKLSFRIPVDHRRQLKSELDLLGVSVQDWGQHTVADHLGLAPGEDVRKALCDAREARVALVKR